MPIWTNLDGLDVRFGIDRSTIAPDGVTHSMVTKLVYDIPDATAIANTDTAAVVDDAPSIPAGAYIKEAYLVVDTAFTSGGSAVLDLGFKQADGTNVDDDGIDAAIAVAALTADAIIVSDGADIGTRAATAVYPMVTYDTAAFTAGAGKLVITYEVV